MNLFLFSRSLCFGTMCATAFRMTVEGAGTPFSMAAFVAALLGFWLFGIEMRREAREKGE